MLTFILSLLGVGGVIALLVATGKWLMVVGLAAQVYRFLMARSIPLLLAGLILTGSCGFLVWKWGAEAQSRRAAEKQVGTLTGKLNACSASLEKATEDLADRDEKIRRQNAAVDELKAESDAATRRADAAIRKAREQARGYEARIDRLKRARPSGDVCTSARTLIIDTLSEDR